VDKGSSHNNTLEICLGMGGLFRDFPHLGMSGGLSTRDLQKGMRPNLVSRVASADSENEAERKK
jgi:hypothetical protein